MKAIRGLTQTNTTYKVNKYGHSFLDPNRNDHTKQACAHTSKVIDNSEYYKNHEVKN